MQICAVEKTWLLPQHFPDAQSITQDEYHLWPRLSPSGRYLASVLRRPDFEERLHLSDLAEPRSRKRRLSDMAARHPSWVDQQNVAFLHSTGSGETEVLMVNIHNPVPLPMARFKGEADWLAVHPDGKKIAVVLTAPDGRQHVVLRDLEQPDDLKTVAQGGQYQYLRWSPDGSALSWSGPRAADPASNGIWLAEPGGREPIQLVKDGYQPVWASAGGTLYFSRAGQHDGLWRIDAKPGGTPTLVRSWRHVPFFDLAGNRLVFTQEAGVSQIYSMVLVRR